MIPSGGLWPPAEGPDDRTSQDQHVDRKTLDRSVSYGTAPDRGASNGGAQHGWLRASAVGLVLALLAFLSTGPARQAFEAVLLIVFPHRVTMQVAPGNARVKVGSSLGIDARVVGGGAPAVAQVEMGDGDRWRTVDMTANQDGRFRLRLDSVTSSFNYRVLAGTVTSPTYSVVVAYPPHITRITVDYRYPNKLGLKPRREEIRGEIDAPVGTNVELHVYVDQPASAGVLALASGERIALSPVSAAELSADLMVEGDDAYRVLLEGADGVGSEGDTEYAIRVMPPHLSKPRGRGDVHQFPR